MTNQKRDEILKRMLAKPPQPKIKENKKKTKKKNSKN